MPVTEGTDALPTDANLKRVVGLLRQDGNLFIPRARFIRPPVNVTIATAAGGAYAANDRVGNAAGGETLSNVVGVVGARYVITEVEVLDRDNIKATLELHLFKTAVGTVPADNAAFTVPDADGANWSKVIRITEWYDAGAYAIGSAGFGEWHMDTDPASANLRMLVKTVTGGAHTSNGMTIRFYGVEENTD